MNRTLTLRLMNTPGRAEIARQAVIALAVRVGMPPLAADRAGFNVAAVIAECDDEDVSILAEIVVPADAEMLTVCRMVLMGVGAGLPLTDEALDDLKLVLSEACASAIEHTPDAGGTVEIAFRTSDAELEVSVSDHGRGAETAIGGLGFGMPLLRQLCSRLDVAPRADAPGTVVRFAQSLPA